MAYKRDKALAAANKYANKGQHDRAAKEYQAIVNHDPTDVRTWLLLADSLVRANQPDAAIEKYLQVARHYTKDKDSAKALSVYRQVLALDPSRVDVQLRCAGLFMELRQTTEAVALYEKAAQYYLKTGVTSEAIELYRKVADLDPRAVARRLRLAELYSREKMLDHALESFRIAGDVLLDEERYEDYIRVA